jgi:hypothetical protein
MVLSQRTLLVGAALGLVLAGLSVWMVLDSDDVAEAVAGPDAAPIDPHEDARRDRDERRNSARNLGNMSRRDDDEANPGAGAGDPGGAVGADDARAGFELAMKKVERAGDRGKKLDKDEWDDLYRTANDAFSALSMHLDAKDPADAQALEEAHERLVSGLDRVRVRGNKKLVD